MSGKSEPPGYPETYTSLPLNRIRCSLSDSSWPSALLAFACAWSMSCWFSFSRSWFSAFCSFLRLSCLICSASLYLSASACRSYSCLCFSASCLWVSISSHCLSASAASAASCCCYACCSAFWLSFLCLLSCTFYFIFLNAIIAPKIANSPAIASGPRAALPLKELITLALLNIILLFNSNKKILQNPRRTEWPSAARPYFKSRPSSDFKLVCLEILDFWSKNRRLIFVRWQRLVQWKITLNFRHVLSNIHRVIQVILQREISVFSWIWRLLDGRPPTVFLVPHLVPIA